MTVNECAIVMAYTGTCMLEGNRIDVFYKYVTNLLGYPIDTVGLANPKIAKEIKEKAKPDFIRLCKEAIEE